MKNFNTSVQRQELDTQLYDERHKLKSAELLRSGLISVGSISAKAVALLELEGIFRAANDLTASNLNNLTQLPGTFGDGAPQPAAREPLQTGKAKERLSAPSDKGEKTNPKITIDAESREILRYISEDFVLWTTPSAEVAYHKESGDKIGMEGFVTYCAKHYGHVLWTDNSGKPQRTSSGTIWRSWDEPEKRVVKTIVMEPTSKPEHEGDPTAFNRWHILKKTMCEPNYQATQEDIAPLIEHLMFISDGDEVAVMYFLNWLATLYQFPGTKIPVAILMYSKLGGVGKNLIQRLISKVFGKPLVAGVSGKRLQSNFMDAIEHKRIIFINELAKTEKADGYEDFKTQVSEEETQFEGKGRAAKEIRNIAHYIITTNNIDALPMMQGDRRIAVLMCEAKPRDASYYEKLVAWIDGPGAPALANVLRTWEFPVGWNSHAPAPQTEAARTMQKESRSNLAVTLEELIAEGMPPFDKDVGRYTQLACQLSTLYGNSLLRGTSLNNRALPIALTAAGAVLINPKATTAKYKIWCWRNVELHSRNGPTEWDKHLETGTRVFATQTETPGSEVDSHEHQR